MHPDFTLLIDRLFQGCGFMLHLIWSYCRLLLKGEVPFPHPPSCPCSSSCRMSQISSLTWPKNKGIFDWLAALTVQWADPKDPNRSAATQLPHVIRRRHKAGKEGEKPEESLSAAACSWTGEVYVKPLPKAIRPWQPKSSQFPLSPSQLYVPAALAEQTLLWDDPIHQADGKLSQSEKKKKKSLPFPFFPHSSSTALVVICSHGKVMHPAYPAKKPLLFLLLRAQS